MLNEADLLSLVEAAGVLIAAPIMVCSVWVYYVLSCFRKVKP